MAPIRATIGIRSELRNGSWPARVLRLAGAAVGGGRGLGLKSASGPRQSCFGVLMKIRRKRQDRRPVVRMPPAKGPTVRETALTARSPDPEAQMRPRGEFLAIAPTAPRDS